MDRETRERAAAVLRALADLAPAGRAEPSGAELVVPTDPFSWLSPHSVFLFQPGHAPSDEQNVVGATQRFLASHDAGGVFVDRQLGDRLAKIDQVRSEQRSLRLGWLFVAGQLRDGDGRMHKVFHPLVTVPVRVRRAPLYGTERAVIGAGDAELSPLIDEPEVRDRIEARIGEAFDLRLAEGARLDERRLERLTRLRVFARLAAQAARLPVSTIVPRDGSPAELMAEPGLRVVAGVGIYALADEPVARRRGALAAWFDQIEEGERWTAFHSLYFPDQLDPVDTAGGRDVAVVSPFVLDRAQRRALALSREAPVTVVSGAPGTGKSHTIAAVACDALARGETVLVAAKSDATVDALLELLERSPGPDPIVFGSSERLRALSQQLADGQGEAVPDAELAAIEDRWRLAEEGRRAVHDEVVERLFALDPRSVDGPGVALSVDVDLDEVEHLLEVVRDEDDEGWWAERRRRRAVAELSEHSGLALTDVDDLDRLAATVARARRARRPGGTHASPDPSASSARSPASSWALLAGAVDEARVARGKWLEADGRARRRLDGGRRAAVGALATALRSGRSARREQLAKLKGDTLTEALPLWVGTLADIDDLLPPEPALFDLVILDEASSIDQPLAATALLRGGRAVVAGDPRQLRQVSFLSDARRDQVLSDHGLDADAELTLRLDVRRSSALDLAAGVAPVQVLDEHFRSAPHLMQFVAHRLYDGRVHLATRSPRTQSLDCIDLVRLDGRRDSRGVVVEEIDRAMEEVRALLPSDGLASVPVGAPVGPSVGIITPFRAQADALEAAALEAFTADELEALDLRIGTAHAFQGNERDVMVVSFGIGPDDGSAWNFVQDPHLFAVLVSRARHRQCLLLSADAAPGTLVGDYLAQADSPPGSPRPVAQVDRWTASIAADLDAGGASVTTAYPSGRHVVDIAAGDRDRAVGIICRMHPDGIEAHIDRHLALDRQGWELVEAFEGEWGDRRAELVVDLLGTLGLAPPA